jgi:hypothetical protein
MLNWNQNFNPYSYKLRHLRKTNDNTKVMSLFYQWRLRSKTETIIGKQFIRKTNSCKIDCFNETLIPNMRNHVCQKFQDCSNLSYNVSIKIKWCLLWKTHDAQLLLQNLNSILGKLKKKLIWKQKITKINFKILEWYKTYPYFK